LGELFAEKGSHFLDRARQLTNAEPVSLFTMGAVLVDLSYAEIGEYDTAVIAMHLGNGVLYRFNFS
jgi:predicted dehydrogenase